MEMLGIEKIGDIEVRVVPSHVTETLLRKTRGVHGYYKIDGTELVYQVNDTFHTTVVRPVQVLTCDCCDKIFLGELGTIFFGREKPDGFGGITYSEKKGLNYCSNSCEESLVAQYQKKYDDWAKELIEQKKREGFQKWKEETTRNLTGYALSVGVGKRHASCMIDNYHGDTDIAKSWLKNPTENLLFQSPVSGNGKTHMGVGAMKEYAISAHCGIPNIVYTSFSELMGDLKSTFGKENIKENDIIELLCDVDMLVIDDIGAEKVGDYAQSILYRVLNKRYEDMKPCIMTTNMTCNEITDKYGARMLSRMISGVIVTISGKDNRLKKQYSREIPSTTGKRVSVIDRLRENKKAST